MKREELEKCLYCGGYNYKCGKYIKGKTEVCLYYEVLDIDLKENYKDLKFFSKGK